MRIALATRHLADATSTNAFRGLRRELLRLGHKVDLLTPCPPTQSSALPSRRLPSRDLARCFARALERGDFDHAHLRVGGAHRNPLVSGLAKFAEASGAGISLQFDDFGNPDLPNEDPETVAALERLMRGRAKASAISTAVKERLMRRWPKLRRIAVIPTGVDLPHSPSAPGHDIVCIGRLSPYKGLDLVLFAFAGLAETFKGKLVFAGYGTKDRYLSELATRLGVSTRVRLLGLVSPHRLSQLLADSAFLVMGSRWEALGLSGLEAMAAARPIVAPRLGGFRDFVVEGRNGLFFEPQHPASLERAIRELIEHPARARMMGRAARRKAWAYRWPAIAEKYLRLWSVAA